MEICTTCATNEAVTGRSKIRTSLMCPGHRAAACAEALARRLRQRVFKSLQSELWLNARSSVSAKMLGSTALMHWIVYASDDEVAYVPVLESQLRSR